MRHLSAERRIVFLDIDGVLNNAGHFGRIHEMHRGLATSRWPLDPESVAAFNHLVAEVPEAEVVVSSTWRYLYPTLTAIRERLALEGLDPKRIVGLTPRSDIVREASASGIVTSAPRGAEIAAWLRASVPAAGYVILDDDSDAGVGHDPARFVRTSFETGLQREHALRAIEALKGGGPCVG